MHNRFLFPFTADNPLDKLMKWKEILKGIFSAQSKIMLLQAQKQIGGKQTGSVAVRCVLWLHVCKCTHSC